MTPRCSATVAWNCRKNALAVSNSQIQFVLSNDDRRVISVPRSIILVNGRDADHKETIRPSTSKSIELLAKRRRWECGSPARRRKMAKPVHRTRCRQLADHPGAIHRPSKHRTVIRDFAVSTPLWYGFQVPQTIISSPALMSRLWRSAREYPSGRVPSF